MRSCESFPIRAFPVPRCLRCQSKNCSGFFGKWRMHVRSWCQRWWHPGPAETQASAPPYPACMWKAALEIRHAHQHIPSNRSIQMKTLAVFQVTAFHSSAATSPFIFFIYAFTSCVHGHHLCICCCSGLKRCVICFSVPLKNVLRSEVSCLHDCKICQRGTCMAWSQSMRH